MLAGCRYDGGASAEVSVTAFSWAIAFATEVCPAAGSLGLLEVPAVDVSAAHNATVHPAGVNDVDFRTRAARGSGATDCCATYSGSDANFA
jgi:hypothetical protein